MTDGTPALKAYREESVDCEFGEKFIVVKIVTDPMANVVCYFWAKFRCVMPAHLRDNHFEVYDERSKQNV